MWVEYAGSWLQGTIVNPRYESWRKPASRKRMAQAHAIKEAGPCTDAVPSVPSVRRTGNAEMTVMSAWFARPEPQPWLMGVRVCYSMLGSSEFAPR